MHKRSVYIQNLRNLGEVNVIQGFRKWNSLSGIWITSIKIESRKNKTILVPLDALYQKPNNIGINTRNPTFHIRSIQQADASNKLFLKISVPLRNVPSKAQQGKWSVPLEFSPGLKKRNRSENFLFPFSHSKRLIDKYKT